MIKSQRKNVPDVGIELGAVYMPSEHASDRDSGSVPFFSVGRILEGLLGKMVKLTDHVCFVYRALFI